MRRDGVVAHGVGRLDLDVHPQLALVRRADRRLDGRVPLTIGDGERLTLQSHLEVLSLKGLCALDEHMAMSARFAIGAYGRGATLSDHGTMRIYAVEEDLQQSACLPRPNGVEGGANPAPTHAEL